MSDSSKINQSMPQNPFYSEAMDSQLELVQAALFHISDLRESIDVTDANKLTKKEMVKQMQVWDNNISIAESLIEEALKKK